MGGTDAGVSGKRGTRGRGQTPTAVRKAEAGPPAICSIAVKLLPTSSRGLSDGEGPEATGRLR